MNWGGSLGTVVDTATGIEVTVRAFGSFDGDGASKEVVIDAVRSAVRDYDGGMISALADSAGVAAAAQAALAARGLTGHVSIMQLSLDEADAARLQAAMRPR